MNFDFAITRVASFVRPEFCKSSPIHGLKGDALLRKFREQARAIADQPSFISANNAAFDIARAADEHAVRKKCTKKGSPDGIGELAILNLAEEFIDMPGVLADTEALVARMPSERIEVTSGGERWILRTRAHVTSCALEGNTRPTKLWWTFEGIPKGDDPNHRPGSEAVAALLKLASDMEAAVRDGLTRAFEETLRQVTGASAKLRPTAHRLNITLSETIDDEVDALLDALYFDDKDVSEIQQSHDSELRQARDGMESFERFIHQVGGEKAQISDASVRLAEGIPKVKGILWHQTHGGCHMVAGFARRAGAKIGLPFMTEAEKREELSEVRVRMRSAARPLSAFLAGTEAVAFENRARDLRAG